MQVYELRTEFTFNLVLSFIDVGSTPRYYCISAKVYKEPFVTNAQRVRRRALNKHVVLSGLTSPKRSRFNLKKITFSVYI